LSYQWQTKDLPLVPLGKQVRSAHQYQNKEDK
jgi:hypothetical protein